jgi:hypothetical protein
MRWSEETSASAPTIKNHSVTHFNNYLFCFGGYDGRRNHNALLLYSIAERKWIRPLPVGTVNEASLFNNNVSNVPLHGQDACTITVSGTPPPGRNGHTATLAVDSEDETETARIIIIGGWLGTGPLAASDMHILEITAGGRHLQWYQPPSSNVLHDDAGNDNADDSTSSPGPCNMHSADYVPNRRAVYVFRGGNGRDYLNTLSAVSVDTWTWRRVETTGSIPQQRANHSSAVLEETGELFIFGGWNGNERLNDIYILDTEASHWTCPRVHGLLPHPRAGMTLTALRGRLYLFGGSGTSAKCFQDLQILDRQEMAWLDVTQYSDVTAGRNRGHGNNHGDIHFETDESIFRFGGPNMYDDRGNTGDLIEGQDGGEYFHQNQGGYDDDATNHAITGHQNQEVNLHEGVSSFTSSRADWRSRDMAAALPRHPQPLNASPNPNDEDTVPSVIVHGHGPGRRCVIFIN